MRILINEQNNDKFKFKKLFLLQLGIIPLSFLPTSGLFCQDATHLLIFTLRLIMIYHKIPPFHVFDLLRPSISVPVSREMDILILLYSSLIK